MFMLIVVALSSTDGFSDVWVAGSDRLQDGKWIWATGDRIADVLWQHGYPGSGPKDCAKLNFASYGKLIDEFCDEKLPFVCSYVINDS